jgi:hypothetical protein
MGVQKRRMHPTPLWIVCIACAAVTACGKKGSPLPPLARIPATPAELTVTRIEDDVYARFVVPLLNIDGIGPADVARVELYALTADAPPLITDPDELREVATLVASERVRRPPPPAPPVKEGMPPIPLPPPGPGVDQGAIVVIREALTPEARTPVVLPEREEREPADVSDTPRPLVAPPEGGGPQRYYFVVAVNSRGRYGPPSGLSPVPLGPASSAPPRPEITVDETSMTLRWTPAPDARGVSPPPEAGVLPSRPIEPGVPPTTYDVYEVPRNWTPDTPTTPSVPSAATPDAEPLPVVPTALTPAPIGGLEFTQSGIALGVERCFVVRPVDIINGIHVRGPASPVVCADFADTFPPPPPSALVAVAIPGMISLIWEPATAPDLAGYLVLRGEAPDATLTPLTTEPVTTTTHRDDTVKPGTRYVYAVVAVDKAGNRSVESNRFEETARQ